MNKVDVKIMAVQSRQKYAEYVLEQVKQNPTAQICYDPRGFKGGGDAWYNAKNIWQMESAVGCTHKLVLQDDIDLVYNFLDYVDKCIEFQPKAVLAFYVGKKAEVCIKDNSETPFVRIRGCKVSGQAILMPVEYIKKMIYDTDRIFGLDYKHDDSRVGWWCAMNAISVFTINPCIVQHRAITTTIVNHNKKRTSNKWRGKDISGLGINWNAKTYTETKLVSPYLWMKPNDKNYQKAVEYCYIAKEKERLRK